MGVEEDFKASGTVRYTHRTTDNKEIYFISNRTDSKLDETCTFRMASGVPEIWDPLTGETRTLTEYSIKNGLTSIPISFDKSQSFFIVFNKSGKSANTSVSLQANFPKIREREKLQGSWEVSFDPKWGGPKNITFDKLTDWSTDSNDGIRYYSRRATYFKTFDLPESIQSNKNTEIYLDLGEVKNMARVKLNDNNLGLVWTSPWRVKITDVVKTKGNKLEIEVANLWGNRLIGDKQFPDDGVKNGKWPDWLLKNEPRTSGRFTFVPRRFYDKDSPLQSSGLLGPVSIEVLKN